VDDAAICRGLAGFAGVGRRFQVYGDYNTRKGTVTLIDDYGHHPTEVEAVIRAARDAWPDRRLVMLYQPHRYTRVRDLFDDFVRCFNHATEVIVCPVYRAGEQPIEDLDHHKLAQGMIEHGHRGVTVVESLDEATSVLTEDRESGDIVITLGAGDVNRVCSDLEAALNGRS